MSGSARDDIVTAFGQLREIALDTNFFEAGFTSRMLVEVLRTLRASSQPGLDALALVDLYRFPTVRALGDEAARRGGERPRTARPSLPWTR